MKLITGRQGTGKTTLMYQEIKKLGKDVNIYIVVPEQYTFAAEEAVFNELNISAVSNINVVSLNRLARIVMSEASDKNIKVLSDEGKALIVKYLIEKEKNKLHIFSGVADKNGFADDVSDLLSEIKRNSLSFDDIIATSSGESRLLSDKIADFKLLYETYTEILGDDYIDKDDFLSYVSRFVCESKTVKNSYFFFDDYHTFDKSNISFLSELAKHAKDTFFTLTYGSGDVFSVTQPTLDELEEIAVNNNIQLDYIKLTEKKNAKADIAFLEKNITSIDYEKYEGEPADVHTYEASDINKEVLFAASQIKKLVREDNYRYSDTAVVVSDYEKYSGIIEDIFNEANIPLFMDTKRKIIFSSPVKALLFLVSLSSEYSTSDLIAFSKTGFSDISDDEINLLDNYCIEFGIKGYMFKNSFTRTNTWQTYDLDLINEIRLKALKPVEEFNEAVKGTKTIGEYVKALYNYMIDFGFSDKLKTFCESFKLSADYERANTYAQIYNKIIVLLEQLWQFMADVKLDKKLVSDMLSYSLSACEVGIIPSNIDCVNVGDVVRSRASGIKAMFILGANEGMLPSSVKPGGILSDKEKDDLKQKGVNFIDNSRYKRDKENFMLYTLLSKPSEHIFVSRFINDNDKDNTVQTPALIFDSINEIFSDCAIKEDLFGDITGAEGAFSVMSLNKAMRKYSLLTKPEENILADAIYDYFSENENYSHYNTITDAALSFTNDAFISDKLNYDEAFKASEQLSVTKLETYARCPFAYFVQYLLKPKEKPENKADSLDTGSVLHEIMERYSLLILNGEINPKTADEKLISDTAIQLTDAVIGNFKAGKYKELSYSNYIRNKLIRSSIATAGEITRQLRDSEFLIEEAEAEFKLKNKYVPVCIETDEGDMIYIEGKIDRIDTCEIDGKKYARIIDYKTSGRAFDITKTYFGINMQLPMYLKAYTDNNEDGIAGGVFYFRLKPNTKKISKKKDLENIKRTVREKFKLNGIALKDLKVLSAMDTQIEEGSFIEGVSLKNGELEDNNALTDTEGFELIYDKVKENVTEFYKAIKSADISIKPYKNNAGNRNNTGCEYCSYKGLCKFSESFDGNAYRNIKVIKETDIKEVFSKDSGKEVRA